MLPSRPKTPLPASLECTLRVYDPERKDRLVGSRDLNIPVYQKADKQFAITNWAREWDGRRDQRLIFSALNGSFYMQLYPDFTSTSIHDVVNIRHHNTNPNIFSMDSGRCFNLPSSLSWLYEEGFTLRKFIGRSDLKKTNVHSVPHSMKSDLNRIYHSAHNFEKDLAVINNSLYMKLDYPMLVYSHAAQNFDLIDLFKTTYFRKQAQDSLFSFYTKPTEINDMPFLDRNIPFYDNAPFETRTALKAIQSASKYIDSDCAFSARLECFILAINVINAVTRTADDLFQQLPEAFIIQFADLISLYNSAKLTRDQNNLTDIENQIGETLTRMESIISAYDVNNVTDVPEITGIFQNLKRPLRAVLRDAEHIYNI